MKMREVNKMAKNYKATNGADGQHGANGTSSLNGADGQSSVSSSMSLGKDFTDQLRERLASANAYQSVQVVQENGRVQVKLNDVTIVDLNVNEWINGNQPMNKQTNNTGGE
jgi:hypothetical protein